MIFAWSTTSASASPPSLGVGVGVELNGEPVLIGVNVSGFFSGGSKDVVTGVILGGLPNVKPTGLPMLPPEDPELVVVVDAPNVKFVPVDGKLVNRDEVVLSLSKLVAPNTVVGAVDEGVVPPNPPNGLDAFSVFVLPRPPKI